MRSFAFLVNPSSGGGAAPKVVVPLTRLLREAGAQVDVTYTTSIAETPALVSAAVARGAVVVSVGGDGMLSSLAGLVSERDGVLGVLGEGGLAEQPRDQRAPQLGSLDLQAERRQLLVAGVGLEQHLQRLDVLVRAEVGQPGDPAGRLVQVVDGADRRALANGGTPRSSRRGSAR